MVLSKIPPTYPWKIPRMFHQQFMKDFLSNCWFFGEVWGPIFPGSMWVKSLEVTIRSRLDKLGLRKLTHDPQNNGSKNCQENVSETWVFVWEL